MNDITCSSPGCSLPARLQCPTCVTLKLTTPSHFCSQACFKTFWQIHKLYHRAESTEESDLPSHFRGYKFTGTLRPAKVTTQRTVPDGIQITDYAIGSIPLSEVRADKRNDPIIVYTPEEIEIMRQLGKMGREVLDMASKAAKVGVTTDEIDTLVHNAIIERGAYPSPLNYYKFPKSCCTSIDEVICHGIPDLRPLKDGEILNIDVSIYWKGFHTDLNEMVEIGNVDEKGKKLIQVTKECLDLAIAMCKPGVLYRELGNVIQKHANKYGFSVVRNICGHGTGRLFHAKPNVPHYALNKTIGTMRVGHVFTIEPMINEGTHHHEAWPDDWTIVTQDGKRSAQFEHTLVITETGCEVLTQKF